MKNLIQFRPDKDLEKAFSDKLALLGVSESEFARRSVKLGMDRAFEELAAEQRQEAQAIINRLKLPTSAAVLALTAPMSVLMASGCSERDNDSTGFGAIAQLVEHFAGSEEVEGSSPSCSKPARQSVQKGTCDGVDVLPVLPGPIGVQDVRRGRLRRMATHDA